MIELNTGVPGSGKTLSMVERLSKLVARWNAHPEEARPIFVLGIPDLLIPHAEVPLKSVQINKAGAPTLVPDWDLMPDGSLVVIDEAQGIFPPRSSASTSPAHVAWLNVHRHRGFDIWLTTQHPKLIDGSVRFLVGKHQHYRRLFGGARACVYEWDACSDGLAGTANAVKSYYSYPKHIFKFYKSAQIHTKQKFKVPFWVFIPVIGLILSIYFVPHAYFVLKDGMGGKGFSSASSTVPSASGLIAPLGATGAATAAALAPSRPPVLVSDPVSVAKLEFKQISACVASHGKCQCYNSRGVHLDLPDAVCLKNAGAPSDLWRFKPENDRPVNFASN